MLVSVIEYESRFAVNRENPDEPGIARKVEVEVAGLKQDIKSKGALLHLMAVCRDCGNEEKAKLLATATDWPLYEPGDDVPVGPVGLTLAEVIKGNVWKERANKKAKRQVAKAI